MTGSQTPLISIEGLRFQYSQGDFHLHIPELRIEAGAKVAVIGPSGSGKTSLINLLAGIVQAVSGQIMVHGVTLDAVGRRARRRFRIANVGFVFQDFALLDYLTILDNILHPYRINSALSLTAEVRRHAAQLRRQWNCRHAHRYVHHLSQGEKQRAAICRALVTDPPLIPPTSPPATLTRPIRATSSSTFSATLRLPGRRFWQSRTTTASWTTLTGSSTFKISTPERA